MLYKALSTVIDTAKMLLINSIEVNEYATLLLLPPFLVVGSNLKGKNLLLEEQILSFKSRATFKRLPQPEKLT